MPKGIRPRRLAAASRRACSNLLVVGPAALREGAAGPVLYGIAAAEHVATATMLLGRLLGVAGGAAVGGALCKGLPRIPLRGFFTATGLQVPFLPAGMASQAGW